jgi:hypothetical protein
MVYASSSWNTSLDCRSSAGPPTCEGRGDKAGQLMQQAFNFVTRVMRQYNTTAHTCVQISCLVAAMISVRSTHSVSAMNRFN